MRSNRKALSCTTGHVPIVKKEIKCYYYLVRTDTTFQTFAFIQMKTLIAVTVSLLACCLPNIALGANDLINQPIANVANQMNATSTFLAHAEDNNSQLETTPALVANLDGNFYQLSNYRSQNSNTPTKLGLLGAAILIGFITHRRMSLNH